MPRIDIELTSSRPDGSWTWRAAGARQPKGVLDGGLLHPGAKTGEVVKADVEVDVDGMTVTAIIPPKSKRSEGERLEFIGPPVREQPDVSVERAPRRPGERGDRGDRDWGERDRGDRDRRDRGDRGDRGGPGGRGGPRGVGGVGAGPGRERDRERSSGGPPRVGGAPPRRERAPGPGRSGGPGPARPLGGSERTERTRPPRERSGPPARAAA